MEKPILFNTEMVKAILEGRKTCTRRIVKRVTGLDFLGTSSEDGSTFNSALFGKGNLDEILDSEIKERIKAPYLPGDILYVRETFFEGDILDSNEDIVERGIVLYAADELREDLDLTEMKWKPSIHMPKRLARIFLKVTDVRVERLQDITEEEAFKEGCSGIECKKVHNYDLDECCGYCNNSGYIEPPELQFLYLWERTLKRDQLNTYGWNANPWVWVIEFERIK